MLISGGLLGLAGSIEILGVQYRINGNYVPSFGFTSIIVALFGFSNPLLVLVVGFLLGVLEQGGYYLQAFLGVPRTLIDTIEGTMVVFLLMGRYLHTKYLQLDSLK
jgi:simple sugar transport system permease protein